MHFTQIQKNSLQKYAGNKKERNYLTQGLQIVAFQQSFSKCWSLQSLYCKKGVFGHFDNIKIHEKICEICFG